jgi:hypothetical protein
LNGKEKNSESNDHEPTILGTEDQEIIEQKPPNDKIVHYKIIKETEKSEAK